MGYIYVIKNELTNAKYVGQTQKTPYTRWGEHLTSIDKEDKPLYKDMKLIADCGSTKIQWCAVENGKVVKEVFTPGMNAVMLTEEEMAERIEEALIASL